MLKLSIDLLQINFDCFNEGEKYCHMLCTHTYIFTERGCNIGHVVVLVYMEPSIVSKTLHTK